MGYIDKNLISGEFITYRAQLHWILFVKPGLVSILMIGIAALLFYAGFNGTLPAGAASLNWIALGLLVISTVPILLAALNRRSAEFAVTNKRVILKIGFIQSKTAEMFLNKIESVSVDQSITGRVLGYGTIVIRGTGGSLEPFARISAPLEFRKQIQEQIGKSFEPVARPTSTDD